MVQVYIGKDVYTGNKLYYYDRGTFGVNFIAATTRYGKSVLLKIFETQLKRRPILIFDFAGEHFLAKYPNFLNKDGLSFCIPDLYSVSNIAFKISDFNQREDWASMGFPPGASAELANLTRYKDIHEDSFEKFFTMCKDLPVNVAFVGVFYKRYGFEYPMVHEATKASIVARLKLFDNFFWDFFKWEKGEQTYVSDWSEFFIQHPHLHINLNLQAGGFDIFKGRANCGKILEQLSRRKGNIDFFCLSTLHPVIIIEEADILAPNLTGKESEQKIEPSSLIWLRYYVLKLQRAGVELFFVTQDPVLIDSEILSNYHNQFLGIIESSKSFYADVTKSLKWDVDKGYREFKWRKKGRWKDVTFVPPDSPCALPK